MKKISLFVFLFSLSLFFGCKIFPSDEARFDLTLLQSNPDANLMKETSFEFPLDSAVVMDGAYTGIEFNFSTQVGKETRELTFYLPGVDSFNVWGAWDSGKTQFEYQISDFSSAQPLVLTQDDFVDAWDGRNERPVTAYISLTRTTPSSSNSSDVIYYNFPTFELTLHSFSIEKNRLSATLTFKGQMDESLPLYSGAFYDLSGTFEIHDVSLETMDIDGVFQIKRRGGRGNDPSPICSGFGPGGGGSGAYQFSLRGPP
ncbi:MAG: hypothetical protein WC882_03280 [Candidatus Gracilibacteria bacterium]